MCFCMFPMFHRMPRSIAYEFVKLKFNSITRMNIKSLKVVNSESSFFLFPFLFLETLNAYQIEIILDRKGWNVTHFHAKRYLLDTPKSMHVRPLRIHLEYFSWGNLRRNYNGNKKDIFKKIYIYISLTNRYFSSSSLISTTNSNDDTKKGQQDP